MKIFTSARIRLTAWYALGITLISLFFSLVIYRVQTAELTRFEAAQRHRLELRLEQGGIIHGRLAPLILDEELINEARHRILFRLGIINVIVILLATGVGYALAGRTLAPIEQMVESQHRFVGDASHELKTPLTALRTSLEVYLRLKRRTLASATKELQNNLLEVKRLQGLTESLLALSRPAPPLADTPIKLSTLIQQVVAQVRSLAADKGVGLTTRVVEGQVLGNQDELKEIFTIILDNAIKYTDPGGKVSVSLKPVGKRLVITVKDTGIGIAKDDLPRIFDRFYRADTARSRAGESGGYGLGLAIAKKIADHHHAKLAVKSRVGQGTTFTATFPLYS